MFKNDLWKTFCFSNLGVRLNGKENTILYEDDDVLILLTTLGKILIYKDSVSNEIKTTVVEYGREAWKSIA